MTQAAHSNGQLAKEGFNYRPSDFPRHPVFYLINKDFNELKRLQRDYPKELKKLIADWDREIGPKREAEYWKEMHEECDRPENNYVPGETWEDFLNGHLFFWGRTLLYKGPDDSNSEAAWEHKRLCKLKEKRGPRKESMLDTAREAWERLFSASEVAPAEALKLIEKAVEEAVSDSLQAPFGEEKGKTERDKRGAAQKEAYTGAQDQLTRASRRTNERFSP